MAFIPALSVAQIEMRGTLFGQQVENTLYFEHLITGITQATLDELTAFMAEEWSIAWKPYLSSEFTHSEVYGVDLTTATSFASTNLDQAGVAGGGASPSLPGNCAFVASFRTANRGRSGRGRNYWTALTEVNTVGNQVTLGFAAAIMVAYQRLIDDMLDGWQWGVLSRYNAHAPRVSGLFQPVTQVLYTDLNVDSQRRRLTGRGS